MQKTLIGTPSKFKVGVRLDYSNMWDEYIIRVWFMGRGIARIGIRFSSHHLTIDWAWFSDKALLRSVKISWLHDGKMICLGCAIDVVYDPPK